MAQLAAFLSWAIGSAIAYEMTLLVGFVLLLKLKTLVGVAVERLRNKYAG